MTSRHFSNTSRPAGRSRRPTGCRNELTRAAARLFAEKGYHGTSIGDLAEALGVQKGSLYSHIESKADLLWEVAREGSAAFHAALDTVPDEGPVVERIRAARCAIDETGPGVVLTGVVWETSFIAGRGNR